MVLNKLIHAWCKKSLLLINKLHIFLLVYDLLEKINLPKEISYTKLLIQKIIIYYNI